MTHLNRHTPIYTPGDPDCPYNDDLTEEDEEELYWQEADRKTDERLEREALEEGG